MQLGHCSVVQNLLTIIKTASFTEGKHRERTNLQNHRHGNEKPLHLCLYIQIGMSGGIIPPTPIPLACLFSHPDSPGAPTACRNT